MSEHDDFEQKRAAIIERIKHVFPRHPPAKGKKGVKITQERTSYAARKLTETFEGKNWEEMLSEPGIVYEMSDIDFTQAMNDKAYLYFFPAFLVATLNEPSSWIFTSGPYEKIYKLLSRFSLSQLDVIIAYFEFQIEYRQRYRGGKYQIESLENILLYLMVRHDELAKGEAK